MIYAGLLCRSGGNAPPSIPERWPLLLLFWLGIQPAFAAGPGTSAKAPAVQLQATRGDVRIKRATSTTDTFEPASAPLTLLRRDEIETHGGAAEIALDGGMMVEVAEDSLVAIIGGGGGVDAYLARGSFRFHAHADARPVQLVTAAGRMTLRGHDLRVRLDGNITTVLVTDGMANLWGKGAVVVKSGQTSQRAPGGAPSPPQKLLGAPQWTSEDALVLRGEGPAPVSLRWAPVPSAHRYRVEITRGEGHAPQASLEIEAKRTSAEVADLPVGSFVARVFAADEHGSEGPGSEPRKLVVAGLSGLGAGGVARLAAGTTPWISTPPGLTASLRVDGEPLDQSGLRAGEHRLQVTIAGLTAEVQLGVPPATEELSPNEQPVRSAETVAARVSRPGNHPDISHPPFVIHATERPRPGRSTVPAADRPSDHPDISHSPLIVHVKGHALRQSPAAPPPDPGDRPDISRGPFLVHAPTGERAPPASR